MNVFLFCMILKNFQHGISPEVWVQLNVSLKDTKSPICRFVDGFLYVASSCLVLCSTNSSYLSLSVPISAFSTQCDYLVLFRSSPLCSWSEMCQNRAVTGLTRLFLSSHRSQFSSVFVHCVKQLFSFSIVYSGMINLASVLNYGQEKNALTPLYR